jgi:hypothetical protein
MIEITTIEESVLPSDLIASRVFQLRTDIEKVKMGDHYNKTKTIESLNKWLWFNVRLWEKVTGVPETHLIQ